MEDYEILESEFDDTTDDEVCLIIESSNSKSLKISKHKSPLIYMLD